MNLNIKKNRGEGEEMISQFSSRIFSHCNREENMDSKSEMENKIRMVSRITIPVPNFFSSLPYITRKGWKVHTFSKI